MHVAGASKSRIEYMENSRINEQTVGTADAILMLSHEETRPLRKVLEMGSRIHWTPHSQ